MINPDYARTMATYNAWFNQRLYASCATLSEEALHQDRGAFFGSIFATLAHLVQVDAGFMAAFAKQPQVPERAFASLAELRAERDALDARITAWAAAVQPAWLAEQVTFASRVDGLPRTVPRAAMVMHMFNHQSHHRGQVTTLLSQAGVDVGLTDLHGSF